MKGQTSIVEGVGVAISVGVIVLIGLVVYGVSQNVFPHDTTFNNESICTTCVNGSNGATTYEFTNTPVVNGSSLICYNDTRDLMTNGIETGTCLGYNVLSRTTLNITNTSLNDDSACFVTNVACTYIQDNADDERQAFYETTNSTIYSGFVLAAVIVLIVSAALIITIVFFLRP